MADDEPVKRPVPKHLDANYDKYRRSKRHETRLSKQLGGKRLPRSGGLAWSKSDPTTAGGDITAPDFLFEHKRTINKSMSVPHEWLVKVSDGARRTGKDPGVILTFEKKNTAPEDWALVPLAVLERLLKLAKAE